MSGPYGCKITSLTGQECDNVLAWLLDGKPCPTLAGDPAPITADGHFQWLLAHVDDGVIWGHRRGPSPSWSLSRKLIEHCMQELRLFGPKEELFVWRDDDDGKLHGRRLADDAAAVTEPWLAPLDDTRVLLADRVVRPATDGFTPVADASGSQQILPLKLSGEAPQTSWLRLSLKHYLVDSDEGDRVGAVRVAVTRLVGLDLVGAS
jgi:CRISPR-associated protein (TIGR03984 family)